MTHVAYPLPRGAERFGGEQERHGVHGTTAALHLPQLSRIVGAHNIKTLLNRADGIIHPRDTAVDGVYIHTHRTDLAVFLGDLTLKSLELRQLPLCLAGVYGNLLRRLLDRLLVSLLLGAHFLDIALLCAPLRRRIG